ncbi:MAG: rhodanese-like domain-containing protein [Verrucomicrobiae bacterium]|nr:rhodanese-like domain-containing protein [Verrucomicrobiae bacterium]MDW7980233.1 rhodanese-like domain-containing protein [Verrucomicrobiales bacterium]
MNVPVGNPTEDDRSGRSSWAVLTEAVAVVATGAILGLVINSISPRGLKLTRNYFPGAIHPAQLSETHDAKTVRAAQPPHHLAEHVLARLKAKNLNAIGLDRAKALFADARRASGLVVFLDARDEKQFAAGHIPGAYLFNHYRAERYLPNVLPVCMNAQQVVIYCYGADCEDSEFAAVLLRNAGVPNEKLFVYTGGYAEWHANGLPIATGPAPMLSEPAPK